MRNQRSTLICLASGCLLYFQLFNEIVLAQTMDINIEKSEFNFTSHSGEEERPLSGEKLDGKISIVDSNGNSVPNLKNIEIISVQNGQKKIETLNIEKIQDTKTIRAAFTPSDGNSEDKIKIFIKIGDTILNGSQEVVFHKTEELVDKCQPIQTGPIRLYGEIKAGQIFITGNINNISRIKVMVIKKADSTVSLPVLKLYEWKDDYKTTVSKKPLCISENPEIFDNPYWKRGLATYKTDCKVKPHTKYFIELSIEDKSGDKNNYIYLYRYYYRNTVFSNRNTGDNCILNGDIKEDLDLMYYVFYKSNKK